MHRHAALERALLQDHTAEPPSHSRARTPPPSRLDDVDDPAKGGDSMRTILRRLHRLLRRCSATLERAQHQRDAHRARLRRSWPPLR